MATVTVEVEVPDSASRHCGTRRRSSPARCRSLPRSSGIAGPRLAGEGGRDRRPDPGGFPGRPVPGPGSRPARSPSRNSRRNSNRGNTCPKDRQRLGPDPAREGGATRLTLQRIRDRRARRRAPRGGRPRTGGSGAPRGPAGGLVEGRPRPPTPPEVLVWDLGDGESSVLAMALYDPESEAILDDRDARQCAQALGIGARGTIGLIVLARQIGSIPAAGPVLEQVRRAASS